MIFFILPVKAVEFMSINFINIQSVIQAIDNPLAVTLNSSSTWYYGLWRSLEGNYLAWEVSAKYANGDTSYDLMLGITCQTATGAGNINQTSWKVALTGNYIKPEDWRKILGGSPEDCILT